MIDKPIMDFLYEWEGRRFENDPRDPGGATKYGVDLRSLKTEKKSFLNSIGINDPDVETIRNLTEEQANAIYEECYWKPVARYDLGTLTTVALFDHSVNTGLKQAIRSLQRACNVTADGVWGPKTDKAAHEFYDAHLASKLTFERHEYYIRLCEQKPNLKCFLKGWLNRCDALERFLKDYHAY